MIMHLLSSPFPFLSLHCSTLFLILPSRLIVIPFPPLID